MRAFHHLRLIGLALLLLIFIGAAGFHFIEGWPWFDGLYMAITTFTTIGYQEVHPLSHAGRVFNITLIVAGVSVVFLGIGVLTQALLEFELRNFFGRRKMGREIGRLSSHYIICGIGRVGRSAARELARNGAPFVFIDQNEAKISQHQHDWLVLVGDATQEQVLRQAQIEKARGLVVATTTDATNLYIVLTARELNPKLTIIARASAEDAEKRLIKAGADSVVSPYRFAGQRIAQSFLHPHLVSFLDTATTHLGMDLEIGEIIVKGDSSLAGKTIEASRIRQESGAIVLAIKRSQGMRFNPASDDVINSGDCLIAMGQPSQLRQLEQMASSAVENQP
jgi:voltage-gated potassium channel